MNKRLKAAISIIFVLILVFILSGSLISAAPLRQEAETGLEYTVQAGDWLSKLAEKYYGDPLAYPAIFDATNVKAAEDDTFATIDDPNLIFVGQKIWIPDVAAALPAAGSTFVGGYTAQLSAASSPGRAITLNLNVDGSVELSTDYLNGEPPIVEIGSWQANEDGTVTVTLTGRPDGQTYATPTVITFSLADGVLTATEYDTSLYGSAGLTLTKQTTETTAPAETAESTTSTEGTEPTETAETTETPEVTETPEATETPESTGETTELTAADSTLLESAKNATISGIYDEPIQLSDGLYEGEPFVQGGASRPTVTFINEFSAFGDLDGDGQAEGAFLVVENSGGSGNFFYLIVMANRDGELVNLATEPLGDRPKVQQLFIESGQIGLDMLTQGPSDPLCCPSQEVFKVFRLVAGELVEQTD